MSIHVGVLHTVPALVPVFAGLLAERRGDLDVVHIADASLLSRAIANGITEDVATSLRGHLSALRDAGAVSVLVTCSSIGEASVDAADAVGVPLVRVDAAMAQAAAERASVIEPGPQGRDEMTAAEHRPGRILVLATLAATLGPTGRLVEAAAGTGVDVTSIVVAGAADARAAGDLALHDRLIASAIAEAGEVDVIVLAQASMASGAGDDPRVLTSPESGATAFIASLAGVQ